MEIELLIATDLKDADAINDITENIKQLQISLDYQNIRYESLEDIYDELYFSIIAQKEGLNMSNEFCEWCLYEETCKDRERLTKEYNMNKKKAEEEKVAKTKADNCGRAKTNMATLQSGVRLAEVNAKGEREVFDDSKRALETKRAQEVSDSSCK